MDQPNRMDAYIEKYSGPEDPVLAELTRETYLKAIYPRMISGHIQGKLLQMISTMINPQKILEIGTFTGYSAICLSRGLAEGGKLITIEKNDEITEFPKKYFKKAGLENHIELLTGDALEIIPTLEGPFDLVFIDAGKQDYVPYYEMIIDRVRTGGYILADNVLWDGKVLDPEKHPDKETRGIIAFNEHVAADTRVEQVILNLRDGITLIRKTTET